MPSIRLTGFFKDDDGHGWSEQHDIDGGGGDPALTPFIAAFDALMQGARRNLLCSDSFYIGCRASYRSSSGKIAGDNIEQDPPIRGPQTFGGVAISMGPPNAAIKMRLRNAASTARSDAYLRGFPSACVVAGVLNFGDPIGAEWKKRLDIYANQLMQLGYGWVGINPATTSRGVVTGYTRNVDGTVTFNCVPSNAIPLPAAGTRVSVSFAKLNSSRSVLNRTLVCKVDVGGASVTTIQVIAVGDFVSEGTYIAKQSTLIPYAAVSYYRLSSRKTGRPFGVAPGRLRGRALV